MNIRLDEYRSSTNLSKSVDGSFGVRRNRLGVLNSNGDLCKAKEQFFWLNFNTFTLTTMITNNNPILAKLSGQFGGVLVARQLNGKTVISRMARTRDRSKETDAQRATYERMRLAQRYAGEVLQNPERKEYYRLMAKKQKLPNARTAAVADFMRNGDPRIEGKERGAMRQLVRDTNVRSEKRNELIHPGKKNDQHEPINDCGENGHANSFCCM